MASTTAKHGGEAREQTASYKVEHELYKMMPYERIKLIRKGIPAQRVDSLCATLDLPKETLLKALGLSRATISRKAHQGLNLSVDETERVLGVEYLLAQARAIAVEPGEESGFDVGRWLAMWLTSPLPALAYVAPITYLDTIEGQKFVSNYLQMIESGAYA